MRHNDLHAHFIKRGFDCQKTTPKKNIEHEQHSKSHSSETA